MNKVDIYINNQRLDIFQDEEISINLSVQNVQDISKVFTDFTQGFTVPASTTNNAIFSHYYRTDITGGFDGRFRVAARIEINSLPFRTGVVEMENVQLKGTEPYAYTLTFYGDVVTLTDLFGEDYLYDLDFSDYDHEYTDDAVFDRLTEDTYNPLFYPLCSPVKNWFYQSASGAGADNENNIAHKTGGVGRRGIRYYELKPALKVYAVLEQIQAKYGITFTGSFLLGNPFQDLSLWLHRFEGYLFAGGNDIEWRLINFNRNTGSGSQFNLATETWTVQSDALYNLEVEVANADEPYEIGVFTNGILNQSALVSAHPSSTVTSTFIALGYPTGTQVQLYIRPQTATAFNYQVTDYTGYNTTTLVTQFEVDQTLSAAYAFQVVVTDLMPEIKVKDFLAGILKMYNMVIVPTTSTSFLLQPLDDWYAAGTNKDFQDYLDITEYVVNRPPLYREIEFKYQETEQILGFQYQQTNNVGFGDLNVDLPFDGDEFLIEVPFECPLFERLTDQHPPTSLTNVLVYKSITSEANEDGTFNPYLGAPVLFYAVFGDYDLTANKLTFVDADPNNHREVTTAWYANVSNSPTSAGASHSICFGADIDPYHLQSVNRSLYNTEWVDYITDLYSQQRRLYNVEAVLPIGKIITLNLQNAIIWNGTKYLVNNVNLNMTTGKASFELLNVV
jgi:hypothetical protein